MATAPVRALSRVSIAWSGNAPTEDTDTLVLTIQNYSVDLRMWASGPLKGSIEWGMVGYVLDPPGSTPDTPMLAWDNIIDSREPPPVELPDEASFELLADGHVLETGTMYNPRSEKAEAYKEVWKCEDVQGASFCVLERVGEGWGQGGTGRSFIGRLGVYTLGHAVDAKGVYSAYRDEQRDNEWQRLYHVDPHGIIPSLPAEIPSSWEVGQKVALREGQWIVREAGRVE